MPIISRQLIVRSRKPRRCEGVGVPECLGSLPAGSSYFRVYGYAHRGDRPYRLHLCGECVRGHDESRGIKP